eukprot:1904326-Alexandrium_andersonii.AAC.1
MVCGKDSKCSEGSEGKVSSGAVGEGVPEGPVDLTDQLDSIVPNAAASLSSTMHADLERPSLKRPAIQKGTKKVGWSLPRGWTIKTKTRQAGASKGQTDTYYVSPSGK